MPRVVIVRMAAAMDRFFGSTRVSPPPMASVHCQVSVRANREGGFYGGQVWRAAGVDADHQPGDLPCIVNFVAEHHVSRPGHKNNGHYDKTQRDNGLAGKTQPLPDMQRKEEQRQRNGDGHGCHGIQDFEAVFRQNVDIADKDASDVADNHGTDFVHSRVALTKIYDQHRKQDVKCNHQKYHKGSLFVFLTC